MQKSLHSIFNSVLQNVSFRRKVPNFGKKINNDNSEYI